jgi:ribosomal protein S12 methylthiotransferase
VKAGVKELLVISQDTSAYGLDIKYAESPWKGAPLKAKFYDLSLALGDLGAWVRLHYVYPYPHVDDVIPLMANGKILPYLDIPFQHASANVLKLMRRPGGQDKVLKRIESWRRDCPDLAIRSTFIVGFPGETEADFQMLLDFVGEANINRAGCFKYETVEGAKANDLPGAVAEELKEERWHRFMEAQNAVSARIMSTRVGQTIDVLIDEIDADGAIGRSKWDAPDIDGSVFLNHSAGIKVGDLVRATVQHADDYDVWGDVVA